MAINPESQYPGKITPSDSNYPYGSARNVTVPGDGTGTPWEAALLNDIFGFQQALLNAAGIVPSGTPDNIVTSQYIQAALNLVLTGDYFIDTGAANAYVINGVGDNPAPAAYKDGQQYRFIPANNSTAASTVKVGALAAKTVEGSGADTFVAGAEVVVRYESTGDKFVVVSSGLAGPLAIVPDTATIQAVDSNVLPDGAVRIVTTVNEYGAFVLDKTDTTSEDNTATISTIVVDSAGGRWIKRSDALVTEPYLGLPVVTEYFREKLITGFNWNLSIDGDAGSALTLGWDEDLGRLRRVDLGLPDVTCDDGTPVAVTEIVDEFNADTFRIKAVLTGNDTDIEIYTQQVLDFNAFSQTLSAGQAAAPFTGFLVGSQAYVRVKKGIGQGKIAIDYQMQDPKTKARSIINVWIIDLDDGLAVRDYDLLLPQCSSSTMNGQTKLGDTNSLAWQFRAVTGPVELVGFGINPQAQAVQQIYKETVVNADLPATKEWYSPKFSRYKFNRVRFFIKQKVGGQTTTASKVRMEVEL